MCAALSLMLLMLLSRARGEAGSAFGRRQGKHEPLEEGSTTDARRVHQAPPCFADCDARSTRKRRGRSRAAMAEVTTPAPWKPGGTLPHVAPHADLTVGRPKPPTGKRTLVVVWCREDLSWLDGIFCNGGWHIALFSECGGDATTAVAAAGKKKASKDGWHGGGAPMECTSVHVKKLDLGPRAILSHHYICQAWMDVGLSTESTVFTNASKPNNPTYYGSDGCIEFCKHMATPDQWRGRFDP